MKCPVCRTATLNLTDLDQHLTAKKCSQCSGHWIPSANYQRYLKKHGETSQVKTFTDVKFDIKDSLQAKICPDCGRILGKYKIGHGIDFYLDHCNTCNGIWLDKDEWEALYDRNLHDRLNKAFTTQWQKHLHEVEFHDKIEKIYQKQFGDIYPELTKIKDWLAKQENKSLIMAYLKN